MIENGMPTEQFLAILTASLAINFAFSVSMLAAAHCTGGTFSRKGREGIVTLMLIVALVRTTIQINHNAYSAGYGLGLVHGLFWDSFSFIWIYMIFIFIDGAFFKDSD